MSLRGRAFWLVLATVLLAILSDWSGEAMLERIWALPAALLLLGFVYEGWRASRTTLALQLHSPERWYLGRPTRVQLELRTEGTRTLAVQLAPAAPAVVVLEASLKNVTVPAEQAACIDLTATAFRLGRFDWPPCQARVGGVLGLAWWPYPLPVAHTLCVVPELLRDRERAAPSGLRGVQPAQQAGAGSEVLQLRDYRVGDPPRAIDWKATARLRRLISRDFAAEQGLQIVLAIDAGRASALRAGDTDRLTLYANVACRLAQRAVLLDDHVGLVAYADRPLLALAPARGLAAVTRLRALLTELRVQEAAANPLVAGLRVRALVPHRSLIVLLTGLDEAAVLPGLAAAVRLLRPTHVPLIAAVDSTQTARLALAPVADTDQAYRALAAQQFRATVVRNLQALRAQGAQAVLASAEHLDQAVLENYLQLRQRRRVG